MSVFHHFIDPSAESHATNLHAIELFGGGEIDIQADALGQPLSQDLANNGTDVWAKRFQIRLRIVETTGESDGGDIFHAPFKGDTHGAGIMVVDGGVVSVVDSTYY